MTSSIRPIFMPERARARRADWAPGPGVLVPLPMEIVRINHVFNVQKGTHTTSGTDLDVKGSNAELLAAGSDVLGGQHSGVGGGLVTVSLDLHATSDTADGLAATGITQDVSLRTVVMFVLSSSSSISGEWSRDPGVAGYGMEFAKSIPSSLPEYRRFHPPKSISRRKCFFQVVTNLRSVTWTKVSLKEAKMRATKWIVSLRFWPNVAVGESQLQVATYRRKRAHPHGSEGQGRCSPERDGRPSSGAS